MLRQFADRGGTVLLSSHLLHEIEVIADDLVVIGSGRIVAQGTKVDLLRSAGSLVRAADRPALAGALTRSGVFASPVGEDGLLADADAEAVGSIAYHAGVAVRELRPAEGAGLEEMFLALTSESQRDTTADRPLQGALA
jgi:ABC-2 type transport system ATP-binding protein